MTGIWALTHALGMNNDRMTEYEVTGYCPECEKQTQQIREARSHMNIFPPAHYIHITFYCKVCRQNIDEATVDILKEVFSKRRQRNPKCWPCKEGKAHYHGRRCPSCGTRRPRSRKIRSLKYLRKGWDD